MNDLLLYDASELDPRARIVTIGSFDGVHRGHQMLLRRAVERANELGMASLTVTFEPIPAMVLRPDRFPGRICTRDEKLQLLAGAGLDRVLTLTFDPALSQQSPEAFMHWLAAVTTLRELWVGEAFALGKDRAGDVARLKEIGRANGFLVQALPRLTDDGGVISSSAVRAAISAGDVARARELLGRPFRVSGEVIHGAHLGRTIGYPTANILPPDDLVPLTDGIYVSCALLPGEPGPRRAMTYVGTRPTVNTGVRVIETHVLDFDGDLYGTTIGVDLLERIRGDETFDSLEGLIAQLKRDERATRAFFDAGAKAAHN